MTADVRVAVRAGNTTEKCNMRLRYPGEQQQNRSQRRKQDALEDSEHQNGSKSNRCGIEVQATHPPHADERWKIHESIDRRQDDRRQHGLWKIFEQAGQEEKAKR